MTVPPLPPGRLPRPGAQRMALPRRQAAFCGRKHGAEGGRVSAAGAEGLPRADGSLVPGVTCLTGVCSHGRGAHPPGRPSSFQHPRPAAPAAAGSPGPAADPWGPRLPARPPRPGPARLLRECGRPGGRAEAVRREAQAWSTPRAASASFLLKRLLEVCAHGACFPAGEGARLGEEMAPAAGLCGSP